MARWEPGATLRLVSAAVDLFSEQGYDATTVAEIAERAGLTKTTFFRHFADKREVLFAGQQVLGELLAEGIAGAPATATPLEAVAAGLDAMTATFTPEQREFGPRRRAVVDTTPELQEREAFKRASLVAAIAGALGRRGVPDPTAGLAAELGVRAFSEAFDEWTDTATTASYPELARRVLARLHEAATALA